MKKAFLLFLILISQINFSQNTFPLNDNVGIGTLNPTAKLHINNGNDSYGAILANASEASFSLYTKTLNTSQATPEVFRLGLKYSSIESNGYISFYRGLSSSGGYIGFSANGIEQLRIAGNGNIGVGTSVPVSKFSLVGSLTINGGLTNASTRPLVGSNTLANGEVRGYSNAGNLNDDGFLRLSAGGGTSLNSRTFIDLSGYSKELDMDKNIVFGTYGLERMRIDRNGKVGIGVSNPDETLTVKGKIHAQEVRIDLTAPIVPDYVFSNDYKLKTLTEVEKYVKENKHLPEIPSAQEIEKDGLMLAEMNMALLKKVEELTLYAIQQQKKTEELTKIIKEQNKRLEVLEVGKVE